MASSDQSKLMCVGEADWASGDVLEGGVPHTLMDRDSYLM